MRIIFLGTPDFAVPTMEAIIAAGFELIAVVTAPDRPAGRGLQLRSSPVKECALRHSIPVLQPEKLRDPAFIEELRSFNADLQVVVAFRMLPEQVWNMPPLGTWNLHASLLPQYRGAAPINHAVINGELETGLSTFKLVHAIDQGAVALQQTLPIGPNETAGELHDRMMATGAALMTETLNRIDKGTIELKEQSSFQTSIIKEAPKLSTAFCQIQFHRKAQDVHNHIRGLSPFPGAHCTIRFGNDSSGMKLFRTELPHLDRPLAQPGSLFISDDGHIYVCCSDNWLEILELQQAGKKRMPAKEFLKGFRNIENAHLE
jgi:methionyl-tRNA formyltransferase